MTFDLAVLLEGVDPTDRLTEVEIKRCRPFPATVLLATAENLKSGLPGGAHL